TQHIPSSSKANWQSSVIRKNRYKYYESECDSDSNNFVTEQHLKRAKGDNSGSENDSIAI
ncbi:30802_t:CDS:2, partial [Gigaspora margarita]